MTDPVETNEARIFNRDQVLGEIGSLLEIQDSAERSQQETRFIDDRLTLLTQSSVPREFSLMSAPRRGFLHPESGIMRNFMVNPFHVDDPEIYKMLLETFKEFKADPTWQQRTLREIAPFAILRTIGNYFGNHWATTSTDHKNREFYMDRSGVGTEDIHLQEIKGKGIAVCAEKGAVAQNLLTFLGYDSQIVASDICHIASDPDETPGHIYNVVTSGAHHLIFDPTNPVLVHDAQGNILHAMPAFFPISDNDYQELMKGGLITVTHNDVVSNGQTSEKGPDEERIYGGQGKTTFI